MRPKNLIMPERQRVLAPPFAWVDRRFLLSGFWILSRPKKICCTFSWCWPPIVMG